MEIVSLLKLLWSWINAILNVLEYLARGDLGTYNRPVEIPPDVVMQPIQNPVPVDPTAHRMALYNFAKSCLNRDIAKTQNELGCAEAISYILNNMGVPHFVATLSTATLFEQLKSLSAFQQVTTPLPGDIIISPTGYSTLGAAHGHVGVVAYYGILSNNSMNGLFQETYTDASWKEYYVDTLGFPIYYFRYV